MTMLIKYLTPTLSGGEGDESPSPLERDLG